MLIWSGRGVLVILLLFVLMLFSEMILPLKYDDYGFALCWFITGAFSWYFGRKWEDEEGRTLIDKETGEEVILKQDHSLFWINMKYWGPICAVIGVAQLVKTFL